MENHTQPRSHLEDCVVAAIETGAKLRRPQESIVTLPPPFDPG
jgi:hypothetical protein